MALARALVRQPKILLLDEPLSAVDIETRQKLQGELLRIHQAISFTALIASHDIGEIFTLCNKVITLNDFEAAPAVSPEKAFMPDAGGTAVQVIGKILDVRQSDGNDILTIQSGEKIYQSSVSADRHYHAGDMVALSELKK